MDAAPVSSTVSWCGPEPSSPSSISRIAVATITHLHLHGAAMRQLRAGVEGGREREDGEPDTAAEGTLIIGDLVFESHQGCVNTAWAGDVFKKLETGTV